MHPHGDMLEKPGNLHQFRIKSSNARTHALIVVTASSEANEGCEVNGISPLRAGIIVSVSSNLSQQNTVRTRAVEKSSYPKFLDGSFDEYVPDCLLIFSDGHRVSTVERNPTAFRHISALALSDVGWYIPLARTASSSAVKKSPRALTMCSNVAFPATMSANEPHERWQTFAPQFTCLKR